MAAGEVAPGCDDLLGELTRCRSREQASLGQLVRLTFASLNRRVALRRAVLFVPQANCGGLVPAASVDVAGPDPASPGLMADRAAAEAVMVTMSAAAPSAELGNAFDGRGAIEVGGDTLAVPLRTGGTLVGVLVLVSALPGVLAEAVADVIDAVALHLADAAVRAAAQNERISAEREALAIRSLFEDGARATTIEEAATVLLRVAARAFGVERAGVYIKDEADRICFTSAIGISAEHNAALSAALLGRLATDSPGWRRLSRGSGPQLVNDVAEATLRRGGLVQTLALKSFVALKLLSARGQLGLVVCGSATQTRIWTAREEALATRLAMEGALIVDAARLRQVERQQLARFSHEAYHDRLTGLPNRALLLDRAEQALTRAARTGERVALLLMDLNDFKQVNDTLGHHYGDVLLQRVAATLPALVRETDTVARLGGDEFAVLLTGDPGIAEARAVAAKVARRLAVPIDLDGVSVQARPSIGIALSPEHGRDATTLLQHADIAMYSAKRCGGPPMLYHAAQDQGTVDKLTIFTQLRRAIDNEELRLHYQPKLDLATGAVVGVEALLRWQHPTRGLLSPEQFLPVAESTGLIHPLTDWVITNAARQWGTWRQAGTDLELAMNVSVRNLRDPAFSERLRTLVSACDLGGHLILEVTETAIMTEPEHTADTLASLRALGIRISLDDFGAGYSSLTRLRQLPLDELKIDRTLVRDATASPIGAAVVETVIDLGHRVGLTVVADGIEDAPTLATFARLGCDQVQGVYLAGPTPPEDLAAVIASLNRRTSAAQITAVRAEPDPHRDNPLGTCKAVRR